MNPLHLDFSWSFMVPRCAMIFKDFGNSMTFALVPSSDTNSSKLKEKLMSRLSDIFCSFSPEDESQCYGDLMDFFSHCAAKMYT